jgi:hypothetical protein
LLLLLLLLLLVLHNLCWLQVCWAFSSCLITPHTTAALLSLPQVCLELGFLPAALQWHSTALAALLMGVSLSVKPSPQRLQCFIVNVARLAGLLPAQVVLHLFDLLHMQCSLLHTSCLCF